MIKSNFFPQSSSLLATLDNKIDPSATPALPDLFGCYTTPSKRHHSELIWIHPSHAPHTKQMSLPPPTQYEGKTQHEEIDF